MLIKAVYVHIPLVYKDGFLVDNQNIKDGKGNENQLKYQNKVRI